jgi:hypothetical protein
VNSGDYPLGQRSAAGRHLPQQVPERADVANDSDVETFCALRLLIDSWRWGGGTLAYLNAIEQVGVVHVPRQSRSSRAAQRGFIPTTRSRTP